MNIYLTLPINYAPVSVNPHCPYVNSRNSDNVPVRILHCYGFSLSESHCKRSIFLPFAMMECQKQSCCQCPLCFWVDLCHNHDGGPGEGALT